MVEPQAKQFAGAALNTNPLLLAETGLIFNISSHSWHSIWLLHHDWKWECVEAMPQRVTKVARFVTGLGLWCDLWLGPLVLFKMSVWGVNSQGISEDSSLWKLSQKSQNNSTVMLFQPTFLGKRVTFIQTFGKRPEHLARREMSRFLFIVEYACLCAT